MVGDDWERYLEEAGENWREAFIPMIQGLITDRGKQLSTQFGMAFNVQNLFARDWFNDYMLKFAQPINKTTLDSIATLLAQAQEEGWAIPTMQNHLGDMFEQWMTGELTPEEFIWFSDRLPPYRTEMIARTETIRSSNAGSTEIYKDWGVQKHEWVSTQDDRTRGQEKGDEFDHFSDWPNGPNGEVVEIDTPFIGTGEELMYPGDPSGSAGNTISCRCTTAPVVEEGEELQSIEPAEVEV